MYKLLIIFITSIATGVLVYVLSGQWQGGLAAGSAILAFCGFLKDEFEELRESINKKL